MRISSLLGALLLGTVVLNSLALAADESPAILIIHDKKFDPDSMALPSGAKVKIVVRNQDSLPAEFESYDLSREVIVPAHGEVAIYVGPLQPGTYQFFNDFNHDMQGTIVAKPAVK